RMHLVKGKWELRLPLEVAAHKPIVVHTHIKGGRTGIIYYCRTESLGKRDDSLNSTNANLTLLLMDSLTKRANVGAGRAGSPQQLHGRQRSSLRPVFFLNPMPPRFLTQVLSHKLTRSWIQESDMEPIPLDVHQPPDPSRRRTVISGFHFDTAVQVTRSVCRIGKSETAQAAGEATLAFLPQTSLPPGAWSYHECGCLPSAPPSDPGKPVLHPGSQTEALSEVFAERVPLPIQPCPCDSDRGRDTASPPRHSGRAGHDRAD